MYKQVVFGEKDLNSTKKTTDKSKIFVILNEGLLFLNESPVETRPGTPFSTEKTLVPVLV